MTRHMIALVSVDAKVMRPLALERPNSIGCDPRFGIPAAAMTLNPTVSGVMSIPPPLRVCVDGVTCSNAE